MVSAPEVPVLTNLAPRALVVAVQGSQSVSVDANATISTPDPLYPAVIPVVEAVASIQPPVPSHCDPGATSPTSVNDATVLVTGNSLVLVGPEPPGCLVVMVVPPLVPV